MTLESGLILRASGQIVSRDPTTLRISATVENPADVELTTITLFGDCMMIIAGFWAQNSAGRLLQPLDGFVSIDGLERDCERLTVPLRIGPRAVIDLSKEEDFVPSQILGEDFVPGRHIFTVVFVDNFVYQALAMDVFIED